MPEHHGTVDETHVPAPRDPAEGRVVNDEHFDGENGEGHDLDERYPAGTYASGSAVGEADRDELAQRDDVEVVDRDEALHEHDGDPASRGDDHPGTHGDHHLGARGDGDLESRGDGDFVPADVRAEEREEAETAAAEEADDRAWASGHASGVDLAAGEQHDDIAAVPVTPGQGLTTGDDEVRDEELRATEQRDDELRDDEQVPVVPAQGLAADDERRGDFVRDEEADEEGDEVRGDEVPVLAAQGTQDLKPGAVETVPVDALWPDGAVEGFRERWRALQLKFIDEPRSVATDADQLVGEAVDTVSGALHAHRERLAAWQDGGGDDTERLRAAVRQYRDFLDKLLGL